MQAIAISKGAVQNEKYKEIKTNFDGAYAKYLTDSIKAIIHCQ